MCVLCLCVCDDEWAHLHFTLDLYLHMHKQHTDTHFYHYYNDYNSWIYYIVVFISTIIFHYIHSPKCGKHLVSHFTTFSSRWLIQHLYNWECLAVVCYSQQYHLSLTLSPCVLCVCMYVRAVNLWFVSDLFAFFGRQK